MLCAEVSHHRLEVEMLDCFLQKPQEKSLQWVPNHKSPPSQTSLVLPEKGWGKVLSNGCLGEDLARTTDDDDDDYSMIQRPNRERVTCLDRSLSESPLFLIDWSTVTSGCCPQSVYTLFPA